jgi:hypothetical protein
VCRLLLQKPEKFATSLINVLWKNYFHKYFENNSLTLMQSVSVARIIFSFTNSFLKLISIEIGIFPLIFMTLGN